MQVLAELARWWAYANRKSLLASYSNYLPYITEKCTKLYP